MGQALTALKLDLAALEHELCRGDLCRTDGELKQRIATMSATIESVFQMSMKICTELRPAVLDHLGLVAAIEWATRDFEARTGIFCNLDLPEGNAPMESRRATAMFRIFQEILTNIIRHAAATEVSIRLACAEAALLLEVSDNGMGLGKNLSAAEAGLGVIGMRERALAVGGLVKFSETIGGGTTVVVQIPNR
jgi:signal transduction histidine kinase